MKRTDWLYLYVFLTLSNFSFSQNQDTSITVSHYQYPNNIGIPINIDETGENTYFLNNQNPSYLIDIKINTLQLDASIGIPLGSYYIPNVLPKTQDADSVINHSQIYYRKGDYDYGDLGIGLFIQTPDSGFFSYQGFKRSPPRLYQPISSQLQNHLMSYKRYTYNKTMGVDAMYHIENYLLPIVGEYNRKVESFHGGLNFEYFGEKLSIKFQPTFQFTYLNQWSGKSNHFTFWNSLNSTIHLGKYFNFSLDNNYKMRINEFGAKLAEVPIQIFLTGVEYDTGRLLVMGGTSFSNSNIIPVGSIRYRWNYYYISLERQYDITFIPSYYDYLLTAENYMLLLNGGCNYSKFRADIEIIKYDGLSNWAIRGEGNLNISWLSLIQKGGFYNLGNNGEKQPVNAYFLTNLILSPNNWFWESDRFQPFLGIESIFIKYTSNNIIDPINSNVLSKLESYPFSSHLLNMEYGFLVKGFKVSYRWINFNLSGDKVNNTKNAYPIPPIRHMEVIWQFLN